MQLIQNKIGGFYDFKRVICQKISKGILRFYSRFRKCSELQYEAKQKLDEYKKSENDLKIVKKELPKVKAGVDVLLNENSFLKSRLNFTLYDLQQIKTMLNLQKYRDIENILSKYDFDIKIDNGEKQ